MTRTEKEPFKVYHSYKKKPRQRREEEWEKPESKNDYKDRDFDCKRIQKYFLKYVGRSYDELFSFLTQKFPNIQQKYFRMFITEVYEKNGEIFYHWSKKPVKESYYTSYYVHPATGILCLHVGIPWENKTKEKSWIEKDGKTYFKARGEWYEATFSEKEKWIYQSNYLPECTFPGIHKEPWEKGWIFSGFTKLKSWRQISSKERKKLNIE